MKNELKTKRDMSKATVKAAKLAQAKLEHPYASPKQLVEYAKSITVEMAITQLVESLCQSKGWLHSYADGRVRDAIDPEN